MLNLPKRRLTLTEINNSAAERLEIHYEPIVTANADIVGLKVIPTWRNPEHGPFDPAFNGDLALVYLWHVMNKVTSEHLEHLADAGYAGTLVFRMPPSILRHIEFPAQIERMIAIAGLRQISYTLTMDEYAVNYGQQMHEVLLHLRHKGALLGISNFGTRSASFDALHNLPFTEIHIRPELTSFLFEGRNSARASIEFALNLGRDLGMSVMACGITNEAHWEYFCTNNADRFSGSMISAPMEIWQIKDWVAGWNANRAKEIVSRLPESTEEWFLNCACWSLRSPEGKEIDLRKAEFQFLKAIADYPPSTEIPYDYLIEGMGHRPDYYNKGRLATFVSRLRDKIAKGCGKALPMKTIPASGYLFHSLIRTTDR